MGIGWWHQGHFRDFPFLGVLSLCAGVWVPVTWLVTPGLSSLRKCWEEGSSSIATCCHHRKKEERHTNDQGPQNDQEPSKAQARFSFS